MSDIPGRTPINPPHARSAQELFVLNAPAIVMLALIVFGERLMIDGDVFWHIAAGEWMLDHGAFIREDPFSYTFAGQPWRAHEWLSEVLMATTYRALGWNGLFLLAGLMFSATAYLLARELLKYLEPVPALYLCLFALAAIKGWVMMRPHLFALPTLVLWTGELLAARKENRAPSWILIALMVLWVNLHPSFLFGAALIPAFALEAFVQAPKDWQRIAVSWGATFIGVFMAAVINPTGFAGAIFPLTFTMAGTAAMIPEWQTSTFNVIGAFEVSLLAGIGVCLFLGVRMALIRLLLLIGMLHLTLAHQRFVMVLALVGALILAEPIATALKAHGWTVARGGRPINRLATGAAALLVALAITAASFAIPRGVRNEEISPVAALESVPAEVSEKPVFNDWLMGGYLIFTGRHPFIDGRAELYGRDFLLNYLQIVRPDPIALERTFNRHGIVWTILPPENRANAVLDLLPGWCRLYADRAAVVHVLRDAIAQTSTGCLDQKAT